LVSPKYASDESLISDLLDDEIAAGDFELAYAALLTEPALRDRLTAFQLIGDSLRGRTVPDDGYTLRILARLPQKASDR
jgi:negative regulator of sigma E activity